MPWLACKPFGDIHSICPQVNTPILVYNVFMQMSENMYLKVMPEFRQTSGPWRCHIAPAKPNGPIPFDLNDKRCKLNGQIVFSICHRAHTDLYRVYTGSCPAWYRTLRPHTVLACLSHRVITVSSPCAYRFL